MATLTLNKVGRGLAVAGGAVALSTTVALATNVSSAQALTGTLNISGASTLLNAGQSSPANDVISFTSAVVEGGTSTGDFLAAGLHDSPVTISAVSLSQISGTTYSATTTNPFITLSNGWTFTANNPFQVSRLVFGGGFKIALTDPEFTGYFTDASGNTMGSGVFSVNYQGTDGSLSMTITAQEVPEPTSALSTIAVLGIGAFFAKKLVKKEVTLNI
jgi:hypothetical protein